MPTYTLKDAETMLGIPRSVATRLVTEGIITPTRGPRRQLLFTFQDMVPLRTANSLQDARIPTRLIVLALARVNASRGAGQPPTGVRIRAMGNEVATKGAGRGWQAMSGQMPMDFEPGEPGAAVVESLHDARAPAADAQDWFLIGAELVTEKPIEAEAAYRRALEAESTFLDPYLNLELHAVRRRPVRRRGGTLPFRNLISAERTPAALQSWCRLEDMSQTGEALSSYERCITLAPGFADTHFNAARIYETLELQL
ncbi:hypothetical protein [Cupriavidus basilensis]|uniref:hypothetical protein n=1 Tax=Cupriavidus basilensis TaxID=68895 RepID=UPI0020A6CAB5|nr:hypothetical protein [Cupriavidus basilensis]MCP3018146.1 hypothetical protein [Cupriavidus basilensis]